jgi:hypothetical protein
VGCNTSKRRIKKIFHGIIHDAELLKPRLYLDGDHFRVT